MNDFSLRELVNDVLANSNSVDPGDLADEVLNEIDPQHYRAALESVLRSYVRELVRRQRQAAPAPATPVRATPISGSVRVGMVREAWRARLAERVHVGGATWKRLGDCGHDDLLALAHERREIAARNESRAADFEAMALAVAEAGVLTLSDLPDSIQAHVLGGAA